jgi:hypothetical protein
MNFNSLLSKMVKTRIFINQRERQASWLGIRLARRPAAGRRRFQPVGAAPLYIQKIPKKYIWAYTYIK